MTRPALIVPGHIAEERAAEPVSAYNVAEADMLRDFYRLWEKLHETGNMTREAKESAAQSLVDQAHLLRRFYAH